MSYLVYRCMKTNYDLVSKEYYKDELVYQQVIDGTERAEGLSGKVSIAQAGQVITVSFPKELNNTAIKGDIWFYCASDARRDRKMPVDMHGQAVQEISSSIFTPGNYTAKISWSSNGRQYYSEQPVTIQ